MSTSAWFAQVMPLARGAPAAGQRIVVGDTQGIVQSFCFKKGELVLLFKTVPGAQKINSLVTGLSTAQRDMAYTAEGSVVRCSFDLACHAEPCAATSRHVGHHVGAPHASAALSRRALHPCMRRARAGRVPGERARTSYRLQRRCCASRARPPAAPPNPRGPACERAFVRR